ncbi:MAG: serine protease [Desulfobacterales bacterium]|nr:serine protease [Desulfobacterales bacterium]
MNIFWVIVLQIIGVLVVIAEVIIPSAGVLAILALGILGYSLFIAFMEISTMIGTIILGADIIIMPFVLVTSFKLLAKSPITLRKTLLSSEGVTSQSSELQTYMDKTGTSLSDLRPSGTALIDNKRIDVVTRGEYIEKNLTIIVISVKGNQIIVRKQE